VPLPESYFELPDALKHYPARFMLFVVDVKKDKRDTIPAITLTSMAVAGSKRFAEIRTRGTIG
jgi:hypothetical protein